MSIGSNVELKLFKEQKQEGPHSTRIKDNDVCDWIEIEEYTCVIFSPASDELERKAEMEHNVEIGNFYFESQDQIASPPQVAKNDYVAFVLPTTPDTTYLWKVKSIRVTPSFVFSVDNQCLVYHLRTERVEPRECPAPLRNLVLSEGIT